jgi:hypothetical protein
LTLKEDSYPDDLQPLVQQAIAIARSHPDDDIRHRVEVQSSDGVVITIHAVTHVPITT